MSTEKNIVIIDYGIGNLWSLQNAVHEYAPSATVTEEKEKIEKADALILPGVGAFRAGMEGLRIRGLVESIQHAASRGVPILGICLGAQLLLERGNEFGISSGLGLIRGEVEPFPPLPSGIKIPAIGWQEVVPEKTLKSDVLFAAIKPGSDFYFVHSYPQSVLAKTMYGGFEYCAAIGEGNIYGTQFHPEKSGEAGLQLLQNFIFSV
jgi:imidazole glycerol-phosphate synthase subunit HisH